MTRRINNPFILEKDEVLIYIDQRMHALRLSNRDLAKSAGVSDQTVHAMLSGKSPVSARVIEGLNKLDPKSRLKAMFVVWITPAEDDELNPIPKPPKTRGKKSGK